MGGIAGVGGGGVGAILCICPNDGPSGGHLSQYEIVQLVQPLDQWSTLGVNCLIIVLFRCSYSDT